MNQPESTNLHKPDFMHIYNADTRREDYAAAFRVVVCKECGRWYVIYKRGRIYPISRFIWAKGDRDLGFAIGVVPLPNRKPVHRWTDYETIFEW